MEKLFLLNLKYNKMKINKNLVFSLFIIAFGILSCKKENTPISELDQLRQANNSSIKLDSTQAIASITQQKLQELYDISALYSSGNKNTAIDSLNYKQIQGYFLKKDSNNVKNLLKELDSLKVKFVKVKNIEISTEIDGEDTLDYAKYVVEYKSDDKKPIGEFAKKSEYKLQRKPVKFKNEFKFYFVKIDVPEKKDSISSGVTK